MRQILSAVAVAVVAVALAAWSGGDGLVTGSKAVGDGNQTTAPSGTDSPAGFSSMPSLLASVGLTHLAAAVVVVYLVKVSRPHLFDMLEDVHPYEPPSYAPVFFFFPAFFRSTFRNIFFFDGRMNVFVCD